MTSKSSKLEGGSTSTEASSNKLALIVGGLGVAFLVCCSSAVAIIMFRQSPQGYQRAFDKLKVGMSRDEVVDIMGQPKDWKRLENGSTRMFWRTWKVTGHKGMKYSVRWSLNQSRPRMRPGFVVDSEIAYEFVVTCRERKVSDKSFEAKRIR